jgi:putative transposase
MQEIDKLYTKYPFYGARRIAVHLPGVFQPINLKKVCRLMKLMGIQAVYPKPNLSKPDLEHKIFPYLLRGKKIEKINQVWSTDITARAAPLCAYVKRFSLSVRYCRLVFKIHFIMGNF